MLTESVRPNVKLSPVLKTYKNLAVELRISPKVIIAGLVISGLLLALLSDFWIDAAKQTQIQLFSLSLYLMAATVWLLSSWKPELGRWFTIIISIATICLGLNWLAIPEILLLMVIPTALAAILIDLPAALITAVGETLLILLLPQYISLEMSMVSLIIVLMGIWGILG